MSATLVTTGRIGAGLAATAAVVNQAGAVLNSAAGLAGTLGALAGGGYAIGAGFAPGLGPWAWSLQPASWRGLPFAVKGSQIRRGRRVAVHEYAFRDTVWVEDLGRGTRMISFAGFLVGDDVFMQRDAMSAAAELQGPGLLVHPSLGAVTASLIEFAAGERADLGRVVELEFSFIEAGTDQPVYPTTASSTQANAATAAANGQAAAAEDFADDIEDALALGEPVTLGMVATTLGFASTLLGSVSAIAIVAAQAIALPVALVRSAIGVAGAVLGLINDAAVAAGAVAGLSGFFGRYASAGLIAPLPTGATVAGQMLALAANRATVTAAVAEAVAVARSAPGTLAPAIEAAIGALLEATPAPQDQIRLLVVLCGLAPAPFSGADAISAAIGTAQLAATALIRRLAMAALASATAAYQPTSYQDAIGVMGLVAPLLDAESVVAADAGDTASYLALKALRAAIVADLLARGAQVPELITVTRPRPLPSLVLAYDLYADATRTDDLVARADPMSPLFMPVSFQALAS